MKKILYFLFLIPLISLAQKKPLDHHVYDAWQRVDERLISNDGKWVIYTVVPQEGDGTLYVQATGKTDDIREIPRAYAAKITENGRYLIFKIKAPFKDIRQAKIDKKKKEDMPKDSLGIMELGQSNITRFANVQSFQISKKGNDWIAFQKYEDASAKKKSNPKIDSLNKTIDSLQLVINRLKNKTTDTAEKNTAEETKDMGKELMLYHLQSGKTLAYNHSGDYLLDEPGTALVFTRYKLSKDSIRNSGVQWVDLQKEEVKTILDQINEAKGFGFSEDGKQLGFIAESRDKSKVKPKIFDLYYYHTGSEQALKAADEHTSGLHTAYSVSEFGKTDFSKDGKRLFFGVAPIPPDKDTSLVDIDLVKVDVWHYKDDYLQPYQLKNLKRDKERNYLAMYDTESRQVTQLGSEELPRILKTKEGNGEHFIAITDTNRRVASQWTGKTLTDIYTIEVPTGQTKLIKKNHNGRVYPSPEGKYTLLYDQQQKAYFSYNGSQLINITKAIKTALYDELNDVPDDPYPYGIMGWSENDGAVYLYDRYDVWKVDPEGKKKPQMITPDGRAKELVYRYRKTDPEEQYFKAHQSMLFNIFNDTDKSAALADTQFSDKLSFTTVSQGDFTYSNPVKAKDSDEFIYTKENYVHSPDLYVYKDKEYKLSAINPQQASYNWSSAALFHWTTFKGKKSTGMVYKPEDFDASKKYPVILYFYERRSQDLNRYEAPAPTPSRLNIPFFVSNGYIVFVPDIAYEDGHPGESAYDYIVSGAQKLAENSWVDEKNMGIQGQSWGGYQVAYLITRTHLFKAAWAGAPVVNMFSAYGGIRWGSGMNRQFQYEKTQSRIGATIWEKPELYIENSPLFHFPNVETPVVIMHNDKDGAVPWYQGIEMFTGLRRLGKPVWMLNYNDDDHNLVVRKNRKDIQIREQQFFDYLLKGKKPAKWITEGVPAVKKGIDWGLKTED